MEDINVFYILIQTSAWLELMKHVIKYQLGRDVQRNDSGHYMCQINTEPMVSQIGMLEVVEAPDILYNETSNDTITMEGASVSLKCEAR